MQGVIRHWEFGTFQAKRSRKRTPKRQFQPGKKEAGKVWHDDGAVNRTQEREEAKEAVEAS